MNFDACLVFLTYHFAIEVKIVDISNTFATNQIQKRWSSELLYANHPNLSQNLRILIILVRCTSMQQYFWLHGCLKVKSQ